MNEAEKDYVIAALAVRAKVRIDKNDPAFILVELNHIVLELFMAKAVQKLKEIVPPVEPPVSAQPPATTWEPLQSGSHPWWTAAAFTLGLLLSGAAVGYQLGLAHACR
jgi:hypothetical protein